MDIWTCLGRYAFFETERMYLHSLAYKDSQNFSEICSNPDSFRFILPSRTSHHESDYLMVHYFMKEPLGVWVIEDKKSHKMISYIRFEKIDLNRSSAETGHFLNQQFWGQGLMIESLKTLCFLNFQEFDFKKLRITTHKESLASQRVAQESDFKLKRRFKGNGRYTHKMRDHVDYQISRGDYHYE